MKTLSFQAPGNTILSIPIQGPYSRRTAPARLTFRDLPYIPLCTAHNWLVIAWLTWSVPDLCSCAKTSQYGCIRLFIAVSDVHKNSRPLEGDGCKTRHLILKLLTIQACKSFVAGGAGLWENGLQKKQPSPSGFRLFDITSIVLKNKGRNAENKAPVVLHLFIQGWLFTKTAEVQ